MTHVMADVEQLFISWVPTVLSARACTETPADLADVLEQTPVVRVTRVGGPSNPSGFDSPTLDWDCFGLNRTAAKSFAIQLSSALLHESSGYFNAYGIVSSSQLVSGPSWRPWDNTGLRRFGFTTRHSIHSCV